MILQMLAIWSLVPLPFLNPAWTSGFNSSYWVSTICFVFSKPATVLSIKSGAGLVAKLCPTLFNTMDCRQRNQRSNFRHLLDHQKSKSVLEKHLLLLYWLRQSLWLWVTTNCGKFFKRREHQTTWAASWEICMQVKKQQLELGMEQWTCSKLWKELCKGYSPYLFNLYAE